MRKHFYSIRNILTIQLLSKYNYHTIENISSDVECLRIPEVIMKYHLVTFNYLG